MRSTSVSADLALAWLSRLTNWLAAYQRERETAGNSLNVMHTVRSLHLSIVESKDPMIGPLCLLISNTDVDCM